MENNKNWWGDGEKLFKADGLNGAYTMSLLPLTPIEVRSLFNLLKIKLRKFLI